MVDVLTPQQTKVKSLIAYGLANEANLVLYLRELDRKVNDKDSHYYLEQCINSKLTNEDSYNLKDLQNLFKDGTPLPSTKVNYIQRKKSLKPYRGVITNSLNKVIAKQDFNGEPFLKGNYEYMEVILPTHKLPTYKLYKVMTAILNGFYYCEDSTKEALISLGNQIYMHFAQSKSLKAGCEDWVTSYTKIEKIVDKVVSDPKPLEGMKKSINIIWNPNYKLTTQEKTSIYNKYRGRQQRLNTFELFRSEYVKGMTQKELAQNTGKSLATVKRYWKSLNVGQFEHAQHEFSKAV